MILSFRVICVIRGKKKSCYSCHSRQKPNLLLQMLTQLSIQNYAIIDQLEIRFSNRLNVITGETGAGNTIIGGAIGLNRE